MASLLRTVGIPEGSGGLVEWFKSGEFYAVGVLVVLAHIHQVVGEFFVVFRFQVVLSSIHIARAASAVGHVVWATVAESFEDGIGTLLADFQHDFALSLVACPVVIGIGRGLESLHFCTQSLASAHVVRVAVAVLGVVASTDIVAEDIVVQSCWACQPIHYLVYLRIVPGSTHACPPTERHAPSLVLLAAVGRNHQVGFRQGRLLSVFLVAEIPVVLGIVAVLVAVDIRTAVVGIRTQISAIRFVAQAEHLRFVSVDGIECLVGGTVIFEVGVPTAIECHVGFCAVGLFVHNQIIAIAHRSQAEFHSFGTRRTENHGASVASSSRHHSTRMFQITHPVGCPCHALNGEQKDRHKRHF